MIWIIAGMFIFSTIIALLLYIPKFKQFAAAKKLPEHKQAKIKRKISLVIPARNESKVIGDLFASLLKQNYDRDYFDINVIVKESDDPTVAIAKAIGANVFVITAQTCKGAALDGYFHSLTEDEFASYDAFCIIDADAVLDENYVTELNNALEYDKDIFVTRKLIKNNLYGKKTRSLTCNCAALVYPITDDLGNNYRSRHGIPLNYCGQGLFVRRSVIEKLGGWPYRTLTEDYELKMDGYIKGFTSMYYPYAVIYTEEVTSHKESSIRRVRWLTGYSQCDKLYSEEMAKKVKSEKSSSALKFDLLRYKTSVFVYLAATIITVFSGILLTAEYAIIGNPLWIASLLALVITPCVLTYLILFVFSCMAASCYKDGRIELTVSERIVSLFAMPLFLLEFVPIYLKSRSKTNKNVRWKETERISCEVKV